MIKEEKNRGNKTGSHRKSDEGEACREIDR